MDIGKLAKELGLSKEDREKILKFAIALNQQESFVPTKVAIAELGGISSDLLRSRVESGDFEYGVHYIDARDSLTGIDPYYMWNIEAIKAKWLTPPHQRTQTTQPTNIRKSKNRILKAV